MSAPRFFRTPLRILATVTLAIACAATVSPVLARAADYTFTINGGGWGHGIGLSQYGAKGYAEQGWSYSKILSWYFHATTLGTRASLAVMVDLDSAKAARSSWRIAGADAASGLAISGVSVPSEQYSVAAGKAVWVTFSGSHARISADVYNATTKTYGPSPTVLKTFSGAALAVKGTQSSSLVKIMSTSGPYKEADVNWRGWVRFVAATATTGHAINYVGMEAYVRGVVPRESPASWPAEALKAQAVAARSYAYNAVVHGDTLWCTTMSQMYNGASCSKTGHTTHENSHTDDAVAATADRVVTYGSAVVQTFFSSSTGGKTANSKDVWFTDKSDDVSPVYWTSVADADQSSPDYRWPPRSLSGTSLAGSIRSHGLASMPSPAAVTAVTTQPGASGYVRYVTLGWSNGQSTTIKGTEFQSALGLKSSWFTVATKAPPAPAPVGTRVEQADARLVWGGPWVDRVDSAASGGGYKYSGTAGANATVVFTGTGVSLIGKQSKSSGKAEVYLDGVLQATVDLYATTTHYRTVIWSRDGLSADANHTLEVRVLGTRTAASQGINVCVDAFDVVGTVIGAPKTQASTSVTLARNASTVAHGRSVVLSGVLTPRAAAPSPIRISYMRPGTSTWVVWRYVTSAADGKFATTWNTGSSTTRGTWSWKAYYGATAGFLGDNSPVVTVHVN